MARLRRIEYSEEEKEFLKSNCSMSRQELTDAFNERFGRNLSKRNISAMCKRNKWLTSRTGKFEKGNMPWNTGLKGKGVIKPNSGNFQKGHRPRNSVPVGTRVIAKGWVKVKVAEPNIWRNESRIVWEKHHGTPVPKDKLLIHLDGDFTNNRIENLILISRKELGKLNKRRFKEALQEVRPSMIALAKLETAVQERSRDES